MPEYIMTTNIDAHSTQKIAHPAVAFPTIKRVCHQSGVIMPTHVEDNDTAVADLRNKC
ncbi:hypothetical protein SAMN02745161_2081 [Halodesulfovibrio marinisediminis DSM 17456]|uniref:Uncharacterized protein n=1 Tax=Halodesulfovibrio marinisediminis DSM 17456 TaxID=1121457 RepID=A0A1N6H956_9BACT|nr:hypothetical protein SAMN02745161_2081 [Halodesulfovibrio marinisediminis DSM 17456]